MAMHSATWIGIDPGANGGIAVLSDAGWVVALRRMPLADGRVHAGGLADLLREYDYARCVAIERVGAMPGQGVTSMFTFGRGVGVVYGVCAALSMPVVEVAPQTWRKVLGACAKGGKPSLAFCATRWPGTSLVPEGCRVASDGLADALCIAEWLRLREVGKG